MATVYLAEDLRHHRKVAIKVLREELGATIGPERFQREIEIAARLHHPHILPLYDSGEAGGFLFYVMPYVEGESLRDRLAREGELPITDTVRILREVADALAKAHAQGVVHRDIKPDNVLLADRHALVADFGVAKAVSDAANATGITTVGVALGTPAYMAPEQAAADPNTDHRADIYAFGALAYELLSGSPPFTGSSAQSILAAHMTTAPVNITLHRQSVPAPLAELVMRCLEKKPADRYQRADEIVQRLEVIATPSGGIAPTQAVLGVAATPNRGIKAMVGIGALVILAVIGFLAFRGRGGPAVGRDVVAVLPFRVSVTGADLGYLREGAVDMLATFLSGEGSGLSAAEPSTVISAWRKRVKSESDELSESDGAALARSIGAGRVLTGSIVGTGSGITLRASLAGGGLLGRPIQASVEGPVDSVSALMSALVGQLLAQSAGLSAEERSSLLTGSLPALKAYLQGQAEYRRSRYAIADAHFADALRADSTFALAGLGLINTEGWVGSPNGEMTALANRAAWGGRDRLGPKDRALIIAALGPNGPGPDAMSASLRAAEQATGVAPDRAEAWYHYADDYFHDGAVLGVEDWAARAEQGFNRALKQDSSLAGVLSHSILLAMERNDTAAVRQLAERHRRAVNDPLASIPEELLTAIFLGDTATQRELLARVDTASNTAPDFAQDLAAVAFTVPFLPGHLDRIREVIRHVGRRVITDEERARMSHLTALQAWEAGQPAAAEVALKQLKGNFDALRVVAALFWDGDSAEAARAVARMGPAPSVSNAVAQGGFEEATSPQCAVALWNLSQGNTTGLDPAIRRLRESAKDRNPTFPPSFNQVCAQFLEAAQAQLAKRPNTRQLVDSLDRVLLSGPYRLLTWENLGMARLLEKEGEFARAAAAARRIKRYWTVNMYTATFFRESGRLAELAGDKPRAIEGYARYLDLRRNADPVLAPEVTKVKDALKRLAAEGR